MVVVLYTDTGDHHCRNFENVEMRKNSIKLFVTERKKMATLFAPDGSLAPVPAATVQKARSAMIIEAIILIIVVGLALYLLNRGQNGAATFILWFILLAAIFGIILLLVPSTGLAWVFGIVLLIFLIIIIYQLFKGFSGLSTSTPAIPGTSVGGVPMVKVI